MMIINRKQALAAVIQLLMATQCQSFGTLTTSTRSSALYQTSTSGQQHGNNHDEKFQVLDRRSAILTGITAATAASILTQQPTPALAAGSSSISPAKIPEWTLLNQVQFPTLALNTVGLSVEDTTRAIQLAQSNGITHVDFHPGKERDGVAAYLSQNPTSRDNLFLNTKIRKAPPGTSASDAIKLAQDQIKEDLEILNVPFVDMLMLRDSPDCEVMQAQWRVMEDALESGLCRSIGVINYCEGSLKCLLETAKVTPAINYYMLHVGMGPTAHGLRTFTESKGIKTFAYGAVGEPGPNPELLQTNPIVQKIAKAHQKSPAEISLRWVTQSGAAVSVRPTTDFGLGVSSCRDGAEDGGVCEAGLKARVNSFGWSLSKKEMKELDALTSPDDNPTLFSSAGCPGAFGMPK